MEELVGRGRHADVFAVDGGRQVLRRYRDRTRDTARQAEAMRIARDAGFPVPVVFEADGPDLVMERVHGRSLIAEMVRRPWSISATAALLVDLHRRLHRIEAPISFPEPVGEGTTLLHLDLQPENVLVTDDGPVVFDWEWAARGPAEADVAHTLLQLDTSEVPGSPIRRVVSAVGRRAFTRQFVKHAGGRPHLAEHLHGVARYRLAERDLTAGERRRISELLSQPTNET